MFDQNSIRAVSTVRTIVWIGFQRGVSLIGVED